MRFKRCVIYPHDIQRITGKSERYAYAAMAKMKTFFKKRKGQLITVEEFSLFSGIPKVIVEEYLD